MTGMTEKASRHNMWTLGSINYDKIGGKSLVMTVTKGSNDDWRDPQLLETHLLVTHHKKPPINTPL